MKCIYMSTIYVFKNEGLAKINIKSGDKKRKKLQTHRLSKFWANCWIVLIVGKGKINVYLFKGAK